jgi:hypothetical protein
MSSFTNSQGAPTRSKGFTEMLFRIALLILAAHLSNVSQAYAVSSYTIAQRLEVKVDKITIHHYHDKTGAYTFTQLIFWDWSDIHRRYLVREWRMVKDRFLQMPRRSRARYVATVECQNLRITVATNKLEEYGHQRYLWGVDPERLNREYLPEARRRPLTESLFLLTNR